MLASPCLCLQLNQELHQRVSQLTREVSDLTQNNMALEHEVMRLEGRRREADKHAKQLQQVGATRTLCCASCFLACFGNAAWRSRTRSACMPIVGMVSLTL